MVCPIHRMAHPWKTTPFQKQQFNSINRKLTLLSFHADTNLQEDQDKEMRPLVQSDQPILDQMVSFSESNFKIIHFDVPESS